MFDFVYTDNFYKHTSDVVNVCEPLQKFGIDYVSYVKRYANGCRINLSNIDSWFAAYYKNSLYTDSIFEHDIDSYKSGALVCLTDDKLKVSKYSREHYNAGHGIVVMEKLKDYVEVYYFSGIIANNHKILNFGINNLEFLKNFITYFKDKMHKVLTLAEKDKFYFKQNQNSLLDATETGITKASLQDLIPAEQRETSKLTRRETDVITHLLRGRTAKEIGQQLIISYRTVETHIENIRIKLKCRNKTEILYKTLNNPAFLEALPC